VHLTHQGDAPLRIQRLAVVPGFAPFQIDPGSCRNATLAPGQGCDLHVSFVPRPGQRGPREGRVRLTPAAGAPVWLALRGQGVAAEAELRPAVLDFGANDWPLRAALRRKVVLGNRGDAPLRLAAVRAGGATVADFPFTHNCPAELAPGDRCELDVRYRPQQRGASDAYLTLDAPTAGGTLRLPLLGRAVGPVVVPALVLPKDGESVICYSNDSWPPDTLRARVVLEPGGADAAVAATRQKRRVSCPQTIRWRVEVSATDGRTSASEWRTLKTIKSTAAPPPPPPAPAPRASG
jgi:hypothetical protein